MNSNRWQKNVVLYIANELSSKFEKHRQQVQRALKETLDEKTREEHQKECVLQEEKDDLIKKIIEEYYHQRDEANEKILKDIEEGDLWTKLLLIFSMESAQNNFLATENGTKLLQIQQKKMSCVKCVNDFLAELECSGSNFESYVISLSATALHNASEALKYLQFVMLNFANYWSLLQKRYANFSDPYIRTDIKSEEHPLESPTFKKAFMKFYSQFVALHCVSNEVFDKIKLIQEDLNITQPKILKYDEAKQILKDHCKKVLDDYIQPTFK